MEKEVLFDRIDRYLQGMMEEAERAAFEKEMEQQPTLKQEVALHRELAEAVGEKEVQAFEAVLNKVHEAYRSQQAAQPAPVVSMKREAPAGGKGFLVAAWRRHGRYALAAAVVLLALIFLPRLIPQQPSPEALFAANFEPFPNQFQLRGEQDSLLNQFAAFYGQQQYSQALQVLAQLEAADPSLKNQLAFYRGICELATGNTPAAIEALQPLQESPLLGENARWYLALAYLKEGQTTTASQLLNQLVQEGSTYAPKAKKILDQL